MDTFSALAVDFGDTAAQTLISAGKHPLLCHYEIKPFVKDVMCI